MKIASLVVAIAGGFAVALIDPAKSGDFAESLIRIGATCDFFGLPCIWFAEGFAEFTGPVGRHGYVGCKTPALLFQLLGWFLLCVPLAMAAYCFFISPSAPIPN